jgi:hypothetical protein
MQPSTEQLHDSSGTAAVHCQSFEKGTAVKHFVPQGLEQPLTVKAGPFILQVGTGAQVGVGVGVGLAPPLHPSNTPFAVTVAVQLVAQPQASVVGVHCQSNENGCPKSHPGKQLAVQGPLGNPA